MTITAQLHDGTKLEFPDGTDQAVIQRTVKNVLSQRPKAPDPTEGMGPPPVERNKARTAGDIVGGGLRSMALGVLPGLAEIGATLLEPTNSGLAMGMKPVDRSALNEWAQDRGADTSGWMYKGGKLLPQIAGTLGVGGGIAGSVKGLAPAVAARFPKLFSAIESSGMSLGAPSAAGVVGATANVATRAVGGAVSGGSQAALVSPSDAGMGAGIGAVTPGLLQIAGKVGGAVYRAVQRGDANAGQMLADALGVSGPELARMVAAANAAPESIVSGSKLTLSQALQKQGANDPAVQMLERTVSGGAGGDVLLRRYRDQTAARLAALEGQGAQTYQGAAAEESTRFGDKAGAVLRTQAAGDKTAAREAFESVYKKAAQERVAVRLPLDEMDKAMQALGRGTVGAGTDARALVREANNIGTLEVPAVTATKTKSSGGPRTMAQELRRLGGLSRIENDGLRGEVAALKGDLKNLIRVNGGMTPSQAAESLYQSGYLADESVDEMFAALRAEGGGKTVFSNYDMPESSYRASMDAVMGDVPLSTRVPVAVPFDEFQRLRRSAGALGAKLGERAGGETESGVLNKFSKLMTARVDDAAAGVGMSGDSMSPEFARAYESARGMVRSNAERYKGGNNITSILRKPVGQDYALTGDEITNKLFHGGAGLAGDVSNFRGVLNDANRDPMMGALQKLIMTQAASKTTAAGEMGAALPRFVEQRMPGLLEALTPEQMGVLSGVASDIRNSEAAAGVKGLRGSDTQAKITRAMDAGLLDSPVAKTIGRALTFKGIGGETLRGKLAEMVMQNKAKTIAGLLADPKAAAAALQDAQVVRQLDGPTIKALRVAASAVSRGAPLLATD